ncbi:MAG: arsenic resistance N-acetyltransferase ArsN2 [Clostridia bacterium]
MKEKELERAILARYDAVAKRFEDGATPSCGCGVPAYGSGGCCSPGPQAGTGCCGGSAQREGSSEERKNAVNGATQPDTGESGLGCARLDSLVRLYPGEVLLDIGSGPGLETISLARRVDPAWAFGLDPVPRMVQVASEKARKAGVKNVSFLKGSVEDIPLADESVDVVVSNCVINLSTDKKRAVREILRVLRPGGRVAVADIVWLGTPSAGVRASAQAWASCIGGALEADEYPKLLAEAGFVNARLEILHTIDVASSSACDEPGTARRDGERRGPEACDSADVQEDGAGKTGSEGGNTAATSGPERCCVSSPGAPALASALVTAGKSGSPDGAVEIRRAERGDLDVVIRILQAAGLPVAGVEEHFDEFIVARAPDGTIVGVAGVERYSSSALLRSVAVLPRWRRLNVGRRLVSAQLSRLGRGTHVYLLTTTAEGYFHSLGFQRVSESEVLPEVRQSPEFRGACPQSAVIMRLVLP